MNHEISFELLQTMVRKAFDPETISTTVGKVNDAGLRFRVIIRDEITKASYTFHVNLEHTIAEVEALMQEGATFLKLVKGTSILSEIKSQEPAEGTHNVD